MTKLIATIAVLSATLGASPVAHAQFMRQQQFIAPHIGSTMNTQPLMTTPQYTQPPLFQHYSISPGIGQPSVYCTVTNLPGMNQINCH